MNSIKYDIDFVLPWVNPNDNVWIQLYTKYSIKNKRDVRVNGSRWRDWGLLRYVFRGIGKYMPWIRNVYLILASESQYEGWMNKDNIKVIYHKDIIPKPLLPVFNSCTIEMFLHNIPGLSEHFLYSNDDIYITDYCDPSDFFTDGLPNIKMRTLPYSQANNMFRHQCANSQDLVRTDGQTSERLGYIYKNFHSISPLLKSVCKKIHTDNELAIYNSISQFREAKNINQYVYLYYMYFNNMYADKIWNFRYTSFSDNTQEKIFEFIKNRKQQVLCINDAGYKGKLTYTKLLFKSAFQNILPGKSKYEN
jgi:hypothetical protein